MSDKEIIRFFPQPVQELPLKGLYLNHDLRRQAQETGKTFVYSNYIASLDGRIAIPHPTRPGMMVPKQTANERDWRMFQELAVQADVLITSGRYLRDVADGRAQEILRVYDDPQFADLKAWREAARLPTYPALAVISGSLRFPIPEALTKENRQVLIFTTENSDPERRQALAGQAGKVIIAGESGVDGRQLVDGLLELGYSTIYNTTGPKVQHLLLTAGVLNRLYLTVAHRALGGDPYSTIVDGPLLDPPTDFRLRHLYYDTVALDGLGQLFTAYDVETG